MTTDLSFESLDFCLHLLYLADFDSRMSIHKYYLVSTTFVNSSLMTNKHARLNHRAPARPKTFINNSSLSRAIIRYICIERFTHTDQMVLGCTTGSVFIKTSSLLHHLYRDTTSYYYYHHYYYWFQTNFFVSTRNLRQLERILFLSGFVVHFSFLVFIFH